MCNYRFPFKIKVHRRSYLTTLRVKGLTTAKIDDEPNVVQKAQPDCGTSTNLQFLACNLIMQDGIGDTDRMKLK